MCKTPASQVILPGVEGENVLRILPGVGDTGEPEDDIYLKWILSAVRDTSESGVDDIPGVGGKNLLLILPVWETTESHRLTI